MLPEEVCLLAVHGLPGLACCLQQRLDIGDFDLSAAVADVLFQQRQNEVMCLRNLPLTIR
jgi:hypothetical protein